MVNRERYKGMSHFKVLSQNLPKRIEESHKNSQSGQWFSDPWLKFGTKPLRGTRRPTDHYTVTFSGKY